MNDVYEFIRVNFKSHLLRILHNDVRLPKIHVSVTGKISLIDFGLIVSHK